MVQPGQEGVEQVGVGVESANRTARVEVAKLWLHAAPSALTLRTRPGVGEGSVCRQAPAHPNRGVEPWTVEGNARRVWHREQLHHRRPTHGGRSRDDERSQVGAKRLCAPANTTAQESCHRSISGWSPNGSDSHDGAAGRADRSRPRRNRLGIDVPNPSATARTRARTRARSTAATAPR